MIRLLVADDETLVREALAVLLGLEPDLTVIAQADNGADAVALAESRLPDIAVLDLEMPPQDGLWAAELIRERTPDVKVMLVTRHARPGVLRRALAAGVSGFVPKTTPAERLAQIIRDIGQGRRYVDPEIAASALTEDRSPLTERELDMLRAARGGGTIEEIAAELHLAPGTVRNYLSTAMRKLDKKTRHAAAQHAWEQGWI
ncbi:response regulator transcription factor [Glycomyces sp. TRM65418]|uniref:response regulator transcription factor n=1 Tax=Glycomyces sp. TRM65418 TaxID=2867006 RepID=UPI001CE636A0|nr:response regulator transcription factor [Glycomyces sp. TRM65418]MCC3763056.1 response regulator transcription factor [Glycomyces sp. TRM65418]QZD57070.1 response regulator transcription factor [Glycomyces sp. TRM65418]